MTLTDKEIEQYQTSLVHYFVNKDPFGSHYACMNLLRLQDSQNVANTLAWAWEDALNSVFDDQVDQDSTDCFDFSTRLESFDNLYEISTLAVKTAIKHGGIAQIKQRVMMMANGLLGATEHLDYIKEKSVFELTLWNVNAGQQCFFSSIAMTMALEKYGHGFDESEKIAFAQCFADWLNPEKLALSEQAGLLFTDEHLEDAQTFLFDNNEWPEPQSLTSFMKELCTYLEASDIQAVTHDGVCDFRPIRSI